MPKNLQQPDTGSATMVKELPTEDDLSDDTPEEKETPEEEVTTGRKYADVRHLFHRLHGPAEGVRFGDRESLRDHLVLQHAPLVEHCARNFAASGEPIDDLVQEGYVGLIKAVDRFDPDKGIRFSTYACHLITGEIRHYLRDLGRLIHEPGWHFELRQRIARTQDQLTQSLGRAPEPEDIASALNIEAQSVRDVLRNQQTLNVEYLDAESERDDDSAGANDRAPRVATSTDSGAAETQVEDQMILGSALPQLRELEKRAITMYFFDDLSKTEIARQLDVSVNHAAYLIKRGVDGLREIINESVETSGDEMDAIHGAAPAQGRVRAAYLLELAQSEIQTDAEKATAKSNGAGSTPRAKRANRRSMRLVEKLPPSAVPSPKSGVASFAEFTLWIDEEARRAARYAQQFAVLWLRVENWDEILAHLNDDEKRRALAAMQALTRRCCRATDKIAALSSAELPGLHFLVLMPHTGATGEKSGQRWQQACASPKLLPAAKTADSKKAAATQARFAFAVFPEDGKSSEDLFRNLGRQFA
jgi:RNA polymerase sigma-B factor